MSNRSLSRDEVRDIDRRAIEEFGMPGVVLMENAGRGTAELFVRLNSEKHGPIVICAGKGNNGGDGFVIGRHLENLGYAVTVVLCCAPDELTGDSAVNFRIVQAAGTPLRFLQRVVPDEAVAAELSRSSWIVDALLGTGMRGPVRDPFAWVIGEMNRSNARVLAVDLPSGLDCDTGEPLGACVRADDTATFVARKRGFDNPSSKKWTGRVHVIDIGVPRVMLKD
jgi:NAD(P)H-hydrate epimerase